MKTQISRDTHRPEKRYSGVYQQQGRMITDSDWNELVEILRRRLEEALRDVVDGGAPRERAAELDAGAADDDGHKFRIRPGWIYADGVAAQVMADPEAEVVGAKFEFAQQADFPGATAPADTAGVLYADVWERPVVSLEDPEEPKPEGSESEESEEETDPFVAERARYLRDPALHGADTTTRIQTMAQIKWAPEGVDPEDEAQNPSQGDARLDVTLRAQREQADECDPCADEVAISTRTGNYLFRLEVHDVQGDPTDPDRITLKWSSENGAEQHRVDTETPEFKTGAWVYELYDETSEKHLGVHLATGFTPTRGELVEKGAGEDYSSVVPENPPPWVRRWDGYCVLQRDGSGWSLVTGRDRTSSLSTTGQPTGQGHVDFDGGAVTVNLQTLTLSLDLTGRTFVAGDFWLATVREVIHDTGDPVLTDAPPLGIVHHYLQLRRVDATGDLVDLTTEERRRLTFPPLTDLRAGDVGYETACTPESATPLFDTSHDTVQKALDQICQLAAEHIGYDGECESGLFDGAQDTVKKALDRLCELAAEHVAYGGSCESGLFTGEQATVREALDRLCQIAAEHVAFTPHTECEDLQEATTVQEALDALCLRPTGGSVSRDIVQPGHGFRPGDAIYFDAEANRYLKALADRPVSTGLFLVSELESENEFTLLQAGYLDLAEAYAPEEVPEDRLLQPGHYYFVSAEEPGTLTPEEPLAGLSNPILHAVSETGGYVLPWRPSEPVSGGQSAQEYIDQLFVGTVNAFAMEKPPEGWLECNGQAIDRREFARLFERIGTRFGEGDGASTFNVPDLRGEFIRGWDRGRGVDPERQFGDAQPDQIKNHRHPAGYRPSATLHHGPVFPGQPARSGLAWGHGVWTERETWPFDPTTISALVDPRTARVGSETRPRNIALLYCIKY